MRFAVKAVPLGALGCAAALLVACGDRSGLLSGSQAGDLQDALAAVQADCAGGEQARAQLAAQRFADRVAALPAGTVDRELAQNLQDGAATLQQLVADTCGPAETTSTAPTTATTAPTTTTEPTTATTAPTTPTVPTTTEPVPTEPVPTEPPDTGGSQPGDGGDSPGNSGNAPGHTGGTPGNGSSGGAGTPGAGG